MLWDHRRRQASGRMRGLWRLRPSGCRDPDITRACMRCSTAGRKPAESQHLMDSIFTMNAYLGLVGENFGGETTRDTPARFGSDWSQPVFHVR